MKSILIIFILLSLLTISPINSIAQISDTNNDSYWLFSTGNETIDKYSTIKLANDEIYNASISKVNIIIDNTELDYYANADIDYYYTTDGFILGYNFSGNQLNKGNWFNSTDYKFRFSSLDSKDHVGKIIEKGITFYNNYNLTTNLIRTYSFDYYPEIKYTLTTKDIVNAIPFNITMDTSLDEGIVIAEYVNHTITTTRINGIYNRTDVDHNGTLISTTEVPIKTTFLVYYGYYVSSLFRAIDIKLDVYGIKSSLQLNNIQLQQEQSDISNPLGNKILLDYWIDEEYYDNDITKETTSNIKTEITSSVDTSIVESGSVSSKTPIFALSLTLFTVGILVLIKKRK